MFVSVLHFLTYWLSVIAKVSEMGDTTELKIVSRSDWGAREPKDVQNLSLPVPKVIVHHSLMMSGSSKEDERNYPQAMSKVREIQNFHMDDGDRKWSDIGYSFLIGGDGVIYEGRGWNRIGAHSLGNNAVSVGICLLGDYTSELPPPPQIQSLKTVIAYGVQEGFIMKNYALFGHKDVRNGTECPGTVFYKELSTWPNKAVAKPEEIF